MHAPAKTFSDVLYVAAEMQAGASFELPPEHAESGVYLVEGEVSLAGTPLRPPIPNSE